MNKSILKSILWMDHHKKTYELVIGLYLGWGCSRSEESDN